MSQHRQNCLLLADYLENVVKDEDYNHWRMNPQKLPCCAMAHAQRSRLFPGGIGPGTFGPNVFDMVFSTMCNKKHNNTRLGVVAKLRSMAARNHCTSPKILGYAVTFNKGGRHGR